MELLEAAFVLAKVDRLVDDFSSLVPADRGVVTYRLFELEPYEGIEPSDQHRTVGVAACAADRPLRCVNRAYFTSSTGRSSGASPAYIFAPS
jgi:hypothetical protein